MQWIKRSNNSTPPFPSKPRPSLQPEPCQQLQKGDRKALLSLCASTVARSTVLGRAGVQHLAKCVPSVEARITGLLYARVEAQEGYVFWMQIPSKVLKSFWSEIQCSSVTWMMTSPGLRAGGMNSLQLARVWSTSSSIQVPRQT